MKNKQKQTSLYHFIEIHFRDGSLSEVSALSKEHIEKVGEKRKRKEKKKGNERRAEEKKIICDLTKNIKEADKTHKINPSIAFFKIASLGFYILECAIV